MNKQRPLAWLTLLFVCIFALALTACGGAEPVGEPASQEESPQAEGDSVAPDESTADVEDVQILSINSFRDSFDEWMVHGLLANVGDSTVGNIRVEINFLDGAGNTIHEAVVYAAPYGLAPGERIPFHLYSMETLPDMAEASATIASLQPMERKTAEVLIQGATIRHFQSGVLQIVGEIANPNETPILIPEIKAAVNDREGALLAAEECDICIRYLEPGGVGPFRVLMYGLPAEVSSSTDFEIYPFALVGPSSEEIALDWSTDQITFLDPFNWFHLVGELENKGDEPINLHLLGTLYDPEGNVLDVAARELIPHLIPPGERTGYELKFWGPQIAAEEIEQAATWSVQVDRYRSKRVDLPTLELSTSEVGVTYSPGKVEFKGKIVNDSGTPVTFSTVLVLLRDRVSNQIVGMGGMDYIGSISEEGVDFLIPVFFPSEYDEAGLTYTLHATGG
jgi:hypothetical protein